MTELPKNGWYVELPEDKNHIDLDKLNKAWKREYEFYYKDGDTVCKYYGIKPDGRVCCTNYFEYVKNLENATHLFLKQPEYTLDNLPEKWFVEMFDDVDSDLVEKTISKLIRPDAHRPCTLSIKELTVNNIVYGVQGENWSWSSKGDYSKEDGFINLTHLFKKKEEEMEIIEIDGKKYRQIDTQGKFENGDVVKYKGKDHIFIGYTKDNKAVLQNGINFAARDISLIYKLEELKVLTWHYAIYKDSYGDLYKSDFYESKEELEDFFPNALEYRSFEEQL